MEKQEILNELKAKMQKSISSLEHDLSGIRTGRASPNLLDPVVVDAYGSKMPISQVATLNAPESRLITVQVWDKGLVKSVEKAIANSNLGLNPTSEGQIIRIAIPALSEERRKELAKLAAKYGENAKVAVRNIRRDFIDSIKKLEKDKKISEDEMHELNDIVQKNTDTHISEIEKKVATKEKDILVV